MEIVTPLRTTRAILVGRNTLAGTGIGPPAESGNRPVVCCGAGALLTVGISEKVFIACTGVVVAMVEDWPRLATYTASPRQAISRASAPSLQPRCREESIVGRASGFWFFARRRLETRFCTGSSILVRVEDFSRENHTRQVFSRTAIRGLGIVHIEEGLVG